MNTTITETTTEQIEESEAAAKSQPLGVAIDSAAYFILATSIIYVLVRGSSAFSSTATVNKVTHTVPTSSIVSPIASVQSRGSGFFGSMFHDQSTKEPVAVKASKKPISEPKKRDAPVPAKTKAQAKPHDDTSVPAIKKKSSWSWDVRKEEKPVVKEIPAVAETRDVETKETLREDQDVVEETKLQKQIRELVVDPLHQEFDNSPTQQRGSGFKTSDETWIQLIRRVVEVEAMVVGLAEKVVTGSLAAQQQQLQQQPKQIPVIESIPAESRAQVLDSRVVTGWSSNEVSADDLASACSHIEKLRQAVVVGKSKTAQLILDIIEENGGCDGVSGASNPIQDEREPMKKVKRNSIFVTEGEWVDGEEKLDTAQSVAQKAFEPLVEYGRAWRKGVADMFVTQ
ncbi:hypothetical protein HDU79_002344 [Rhizoclosmatium sp. JEL0117]|nr:hypothetical protein HDU79_002344 [Rhizoclosmatium sp. JEL0117]